MLPLIVVYLAFRSNALSVSPFRSENPVATSITSSTRIGQTSTAWWQAEIDCCNGSDLHIFMFVFCELSLATPIRALLSSQCLMATRDYRVLSRHQSPAYRFAFGTACGYFQIGCDLPLLRGEVSRHNHHLSRQTQTPTISTNCPFGMTTHLQACSHLRIGAVPWTPVDCLSHPTFGLDFNESSVAMAKIDKVAMSDRRRSAKVHGQFPN
jgi:hypothetical protein